MHNSARYIMVQTWYWIFITLYLFHIASVKCEMEAFVVGGQIADIKKFPHSAYLLIECVYSDGIPRYSSCGSSILNQQVLLSAAHCLNDCTRKSEILAIVGHQNRDKGKSMKVKTFLIHGRYNPANHEYDMALLKLRKTLEFSQNVGRVAIMKNPPYFEKAQIAGWGHVDEINGVHTNVLHYVDQYVWNREKCKKSDFMVYYGVFCAQAHSNAKYSSRGDSGSALIVRGYIQIGIVSYKYMTEDRSVVMYTDTGIFYDWIQRNTNKLYCL